MATLWWYGTLDTENGPDPSINEKFYFLGVLTILGGGLVYDSGEL